MITKDEIFSKIYTVIKDDLEVTSKIKIEPSSAFKEIGLDSIQLMQLYVLIEENFGFEFGEELIGNDKFSKIEDVIDYVYETNSIKNTQDK
jgi:acyl carrier protein